jgi:hypothetical protein
MLIVYHILFDRTKKMLGDDISQQFEYQAQQIFQADGPVSIYCFFLEREESNLRFCSLFFRV